MEINFQKGLIRYPDKLKNEEIAKNISVYGEYDTVKRYSENAFYDGQKALLKTILNDVKKAPNLSMEQYFEPYKIDKIED